MIFEGWVCIQFNQPHLHFQQFEGNTLLTIANTMPALNYSLSIPDVLVDHLQTQSQCHSDI